MDAKKYADTGKRIRQLRNAFGLTQSGFALKCGINRGYLAALEVGNKKPSSNVISQLIDATNVSSNWLLTGDGHMFVPQPHEPPPGDEEAVAAVHVVQEDAMMQKMVLMLQAMSEEKKRSVFDYICEKKQLVDLEKTVSELKVERAG